MGVYRRKGSRFWWIRVQPPGGGKPIQVSSKTVNKRLAEDIWRKMEREAVEGLHFPDRVSKGMTVAELRASWLRQCATTLPKSVKGYRSFSQHVEAFFGPQQRVTAITRKDVLALQQSRIEARKPDGSPYSGGHVNQVMAALRSMFNHALDLEVIRESPVKRIRTQKQKERDVVWTEDDLRAFVEVADRELGVFLSVAYLTGIRRTALATTEWLQVDLDDGFIGLKADQTKTAQARLVPLTSEAHCVLAFWRAENPGAERVFQSNPQSIGNRFRLARARLGLDHLHIHDLRHSAATNLRRAKVDPLTIAKITGHSTVTAMRRYNHFAEDDLLEAARKRDDL